MKIASLTDIENIEQTPISARGWPQNTYALLSRAAAAYGAAPALTWLPDAGALNNTKAWSFEALHAEVTRAANLFRELGCRGDDVIAYVLPNLPETHFVLWGAEACAVAFAINPMLAPDMMLALLKSMRVKVLVVAPSVLSTPTREALETAELPHLQTILVVGPGEIAARQAKTLAFAPELARQRGDALASARQFSPHDRSSAFCTGGTTGAPKVALRTHSAEAANACMAASVLAGAIGEGDRVFCGLPLFHVNAVLVTGIMAWSMGAHVVLGPPAGYRDRALLENFWSIVERFGINLFSGVPTLYSALLDVPMRGVDVSSLKLGLCGAAPMPPELFRRFEAATGIRILEGYGMTETACVASINPVDGERRVGSIGFRLPYQDVRIAVVEGGEARDGGIDEVGVLAICGPNVFSGYADPAQDAWIDFGDGQRWLDTGDLGRIDCDGYLWLAGRKKELIIRGGHNIDPKMIEEALHRHPKVALAAAVGRPDAHAGEVPVAYVELRDGADAAPEELLAFARTQVAESAAVPKAIVVVDRLPVTAVGKLFKPALVQREIEGVIRTVANEIGVRLLAIDVVQDSRRGLVARITAEREDAIKEALGAYAFAVDVKSVHG